MMEKSSFYLWILALSLGVLIGYVSILLKMKRNKSSFNAEHYLLLFVILVLNVVVNYQFITDN